MAARLDTSPRSSEPASPAIQRSPASTGPAAHDDDQAIDQLEEGATQDDRGDEEVKLEDTKAPADPEELDGPTKPNKFTAPSLKPATSTLASLGGGHGGRTQATFVRKLYTMIEDAPEPSADNPSPPMPLIAWSRNGETFVVHNLTEFSGVVLPQYFKHNNWQSFVRQLNMYGFHKVNDIMSGASPSVDNPAQAWEFQHPSFRRGRPDLFQHIKRKTAKPAGPAGPLVGPAAGPDPHHHHPHHPLQQPMLAPYLQPAPPPPPPSAPSSSSTPAYTHPRSQHAQPAPPAPAAPLASGEAGPDAGPWNRGSISSSAGSSAASNGGRPRSALPPPAAAVAPVGYPAGRSSQTGAADAYPAPPPPPPPRPSSSSQPPPVQHQPHFGAGVPAHGWPQPPPRRDWHGPDHVAPPPPPPAPARRPSHHLSASYHQPSLGEEFEALHRRLDHLADAFYRSRQDTIVGKRDTAVVLKTILDVLSGIVDDPARAAREIEAGASEKYRGGVALAQDAITKLEMQARADADALSQQSDRPRSSSGSYTSHSHHPLPSHHHHHQLHQQTGYHPPYPSSGPGSAPATHRSSALEASPHASPAADHAGPNGSSSVNARSSFPRPPTATTSSSSSSTRKPSSTAAAPAPAGSSSNPVQSGDWGPTLSTPYGPSPVAVSAWIPPRAPSAEQVKREREAGSTPSKDGPGGPSPGMGPSGVEGRGGGGGGGGGSGRMGAGVQLPPLSALLRGPEESFERGQQPGSGVELDERASKRPRYGLGR